MKKKMKKIVVGEGERGLHKVTHRNLCYLNSPLQHCTSAAARAAAHTQRIVAFTKLIEKLISFPPILEGPRPYIEGNGIPSPSLPYCIRSKDVVHRTHDSWIHEE